MPVEFLKTRIVIMLQTELTSKQEKLTGIKKDIIG